MIQRAKWAEGVAMLTSQPEPTPESVRLEKRRRCQWMARHDPNWSAVRMLFGGSRSGIIDDAWRYGVLAGFLGIAEAATLTVARWNKGAEVLADFKRGCDCGASYGLADVAEDLIEMRQSDEVTFDELIIRTRGCIEGPRMIDALSSKTIVAEREAEITRFARGLLCDKKREQAVLRLTRHSQ